MEFRLSWMGIPVERHAVSGFSGIDPPEQTAWISAILAYCLLLESLCHLWNGLSRVLWSDIDWDNQTALICRQRVSSCKMDDSLQFTGNGKEDLNHQKQHVAPHAIFLPNPAIDILKKIKMLNLSQEYVFPPGKFRYHTYNEKVKEAAKAVGLKAEEYHSHCIRATMATNLYKLTGGDLRQVQYQMRHTTTKMTEKYIDDWWTLDATRNSWENTAE